MFAFQERSELLARAEKLAAMAKIIEHEPECLEKSVIQVRVGPCPFPYLDYSNLYSRLAVFYILNQ